jgi:hypothetical protein
MNEISGGWVEEAMQRFQTLYMEMLKRAIARKIFDNNPCRIIFDCRDFVVSETAMGEVVSEFFRGDLTCEDLRLPEGKRKAEKVPVVLVVYPRRGIFYLCEEGSFKSQFGNPFLD